MSRRGSTVHPSWILVDEDNDEQRVGVYTGLVLQGIPVIAQQVGPTERDSSVPSVRRDSSSLAKMTVKVSPPNDTYETA